MVTHGPRVFARGDMQGLNSGPRLAGWVDMQGQNSGPRLGGRGDRELSSQALFMSSRARLNVIAGPFECHPGPV
jgi:hypothetical protein